MFRRRPRQASVLIIVLVTIVFATTALLAFIEHSSDQLIVPVRHAAANRMRAEAYSALDTTLAVLVNFYTVNGGLHSPCEGWNDPLSQDWGGYTPAEGHTITVSFEDESGKMSLPNATAQNLTDLFTYWQMDSGTVAQLVDDYFTWTKTNYVPTSNNVPTLADFQNDPLPFNPPVRSLRSWDELATIDGFRDEFFDAQGRPNVYGRRFRDAFSLYKFTTPNINAVNPNTLAVLAQLDDDAQQGLRSAVLGDVDPVTAGDPNAIPYAAGPAHPAQSYFGTIQTATQVSGASSLTGLGVTISALRVNITVKQGDAIFNLSALVTTTTATTAATAVAAPAPAASAGTGTTATTSTATATEIPPIILPSTTTSNTTTSSATTTTIGYPLAILELTESDLDPTIPVVVTSTASQNEPAN